VPWNGDMGARREPQWSHERGSRNVRNRTRFRLCAGAHDGQPVSRRPAVEGPTRRLYNRGDMTKQTMVVVSALFGLGSACDSRTSSARLDGAVEVGLPGSGGTGSTTVTGSGGATVSGTGGSTVTGTGGATAAGTGGVGTGGIATGGVGGGRGGNSGTGGGGAGGGRGAARARAEAVPAELGRSSTEGRRSPTAASTRMLLPTEAPATRFPPARASGAFASRR